MPTKFLRSVVASTYNASDVPTPYPGYAVNSTVPPWALSWAALWDAEKNRDSYYSPSPWANPYGSSDNSYMSSPGNQPQIIIVPMPAGTPSVTDGTAEVDETNGLNPGTPQPITQYPQQPIYPINPYGTNPYGTNPYGTNPYGGLTDPGLNYPGLTDYGNGSNIFDQPEAQIEEPATDSSGTSPLMWVVPTAVGIAFWQRKRIRDWIDKKRKEHGASTGSKATVVDPDTGAELPVARVPVRTGTTTVHVPESRPVHIVSNLPEASIPVVTLSQPAARMRPQTAVYPPLHRSTARYRVIRPTRRPGR